MLRSLCDAMEHRGGERERERRARHGSGPLLGADTCCARTLSPLSSNNAAARSPTSSPAMARSRPLRSVAMTCATGLTTGEQLERRRGETAVPVAVCLPAVHERARSKERSAAKCPFSLITHSPSAQLRIRNAYRVVFATFVCSQWLIDILLCWCARFVDGVGVLRRSRVPPLPLPLLALRRRSSRSAGMQEQQQQRRRRQRTLFATPLCGSCAVHKASCADAERAPAAALGFAPPQTPPTLHCKRPATDDNPPESKTNTHIHTTGCRSTRSPSWASSRRSGTRRRASRRRSTPRASRRCSRGARAAAARWRLVGSIVALPRAGLGAGDGAVVANGRGVWLVRRLVRKH